MGKQRPHRTETQLPHVDNDRHAVLALGWISAALGESDKVPTAPELLDMWRDGLAATRTSALHDPAMGLMYAGAVAAKGNVDEAIAAIPQAPTGTAEAVSALLDGDTKPQRIPGPVPAVAMMPCQEEGCTNEVPADKGMPFCPDHMPSPNLMEIEEP